MLLFGYASGITTQGKRGRPQKPFITSWNEPVVGLRRERDGRWRIVATRETFAEPDERLAVARFRRWQTDNAAPTDVMIPPAENQRRDWKAVVAEATESDGRIYDMTLIRRHTIGFAVDENAAWAWFREQLIAHPAHVAKMTGFPQLASLADLPMPKRPIRLDHLLEVYKAHSASKPDTKRDAAVTYSAFMNATGAVTLADLTADVLKAYRRGVIEQGKTPATTAAYFGRVKWVVAFGKTEGEDAVQIDAALSRLSILEAPKDKRTHQPTPVSRDDFGSLVATAVKDYPEWHDRLLVALNLCLHLDETLAVQWDELNLDRGTFTTHRSKTGVIRAAALWPQTMAMLRQRQQRGPFVFTSSHGTRFVSKGQWKTWEKLRVAAGCPQVQFDDIRDGAYTAACHAAGVDEKYARLLAGHKSHGLQDNYVQRNPLVVKPANDAVLAAYFG